MAADEQNQTSDEQQQKKTGFFARMRERARADKEAAQAADAINRDLAGRRAEEEVARAVSAAEAGDATAAAEAAKKAEWYKKMSTGLGRSSNSLGDGIAAIFSGGSVGDAELQDLEDLLIQSDLGVETASDVVDALRSRNITGDAAAAVSEALAEEVSKTLEPVAWPLEIRHGLKPHIILMVGVNGSGKTTTIGKMASQFKAQGKKVMIGAGDTFRAAAIEQVKVWGERSNVPVIAREQGADSAAVAFEALAAAKEADADLLLLDTAGRLQNKADLMAELEKIVRVIRKQDETGPHSVLLVLDATTGQNAMNQVEVFKQTCDVSGLVMTKLDGTAKGGVLVPLARKFKLPIHAIGVGEGIDDLQPFDAFDFARALVGMDKFLGSLKSDQ